MIRSPFIVYALPRSRTAWMAKFLSYGGWRVGHEQAIHMRSLADIKAVMSRPMTGTVETAAAQAWRIIQHHVPGLRSAVIRRPVDDVVAAMLAIDLGGEFHYDPDQLRRRMAYGDRMLAQVAAQPNVLELQFADLATERGCKALFEHCLQRPFDAAWWQSLRAENVQVNVLDVIRYYHKNFIAINRLKAELWRELRYLAETGQIAKGNPPCRR